MALTDYERYQLEWMIDHGHGLGELVDELTGLQNDLEEKPGVNLSVRDVFDAWEAERGFGGEVFACEAEWRDAEGRELEEEGWKQEPDQHLGKEFGTITKDMVRDGIEHGVIRFEANPDPTDPWKTMCCVGEDGGLFYFADTTDIPVSEYIRMNQNNLDMVVDDVWEALNGDILRDFADDYERYAAILREPHQGGTGSIMDGNRSFDKQAGETVKAVYALVKAMEGGSVDEIFNRADALTVQAMRTERQRAEQNGWVEDFDRLIADCEYVVGEEDISPSDMETAIDSIVRELGMAEENGGSGGHGIAVGVGYCFSIVDAQEASGIDLKDTGTVVTVDGQDYRLMKGATYEDSLRVDALLDSHGEKRISDYEKQPQGMSLKQAAREAREASDALTERKTADDPGGKYERER